MGPRRVVAAILMAIGTLTATIGIFGFVFTGGQRPAAVRTPTGSTPSTEQLIRTFYSDLSGAFRTGNEAFLFDHLHPEVVKLYGEQQCRQFVSGLTGNRTFEVQRIHQPAPWNYGEQEGQQILISNAIQVDVIHRKEGGEQAQQSTHVVVAGRVVQWFTDCGNLSSRTVSRHARSVSADLRAAVKA